MLGLPQSTEVNRLLPKKLLFDKLKLTPTDQKRLDADIHRLVIANELSPKTTSLAAGQQVAAVYVMQLGLRRRNFDRKTIELLVQSFRQHMLFVLEFAEETCLAVCRGRVLHTEWMPFGEEKISLVGLNLDAVWDGIVATIADIDLKPGQNLDEQIERFGKLARLREQLRHLEQKTRLEKQPKRKWAMRQKIERLQETIKEYENG